MALSPGTRLGAYEILEAIGSGGMGEVYRAHDRRLGRDVAIKVLPAVAAADVERRARFDREARAVAALNHPNIITIHAVEEADGIPFFAMEYVQGRTLGQTIPARGLPLDELLRIAIPLTDAVAAAHQRGILHRDIKPANVMLTAEGRVKVLDFGLAKLREAAAVQAGSASQATKEATGEERILGTVAYMSPEQAEGKAIDERSDVFSLGIVLYEMATGQRPFKGDTSVSVISAILKDTPGSVTDLRPELPRDLGRILRRALNKDPERRYQSAKDLRNDLETLKEDLDSGEIARGAGQPDRGARPRRHKALLAAGLLAVVVVVAAAAWWVSRVLNPPPQARAARSFDEFTVTSLTTAEKVTAQAGVAVSPDGRYVAYVAVDDSDRQSLRVRQADTPASVEVVPPGTTRYIDVTFSPDGSRLYYVASLTAGPGTRTLYEVPALGGTAPHRLIADVDSGVGFSPDGGRIAFVRGISFTASAIVLANVDGTDQHVLAMGEEPRRFGIVSPAWSADGRTLAAAVQDEATRQTLVTVDVTTGAVRPTKARKWPGILQIAWPRNESRLLIAAVDFVPAGNSQIWEITLPDGGARRVTKDTANYFQFSLTADARTLVSVRSDSQRTMWVAPSTDPDRLTRIASVPNTVAAFQPIRWTNDDRIVYATGGGGDRDIWSVRADGSDLRQLTRGPAAKILPTVSPDGRYIAFVSRRGQESGLWRMDPDGGGQVMLTSGPLDSPLFAADSQSLYFYRSGLWTVPIAGGPPRILVGAAPATPAPAWSKVPVTFHPYELSPNGSLILGWYLDQTQNPVSTRVAIVPERGQGPVRTLDLVLTSLSAAWAPDGRAITFARRSDGAANLWRQSIDGGAPTRVTHYTGDDTFHSHAWSRDGRFLALVRAVPDRQLVMLKDVARGRQ